MFGDYEEQEVSNLIDLFILIQNFRVQSVLNEGTDHFHGGGSEVARGMVLMELLHHFQRGLDFRFEERSLFIFAHQLHGEGIEVFLHIH